MDLQTMKLILNEAEEKLMRLRLDAQRAAIEKEKRDQDIRNTEAVIVFLSDDVSRAEEIDAEAYEPPVTNDEVPPRNTTDMPFSLPTRTWQDRIKAFFKYKNRVLTIEQIVDEFRKHLPVEEYSDDSLKGVVSNTVALMVKNQVVKSYRPPYKMRGLYYGNPLWFDGETPREEHMPDLKERLLW